MKFRAGQTCILSGTSNVQGSYKLRGWKAVRYGTKRVIATGLFAILLGLVALQCVALTGCTWLKSEAADVKSAVVDCTKAEAAKVVHDLGPLAEVALVQAIDPDSKVAWAPIETLFKDAAADVGGCALASAVQKLLIPPQPQASAPKSEPIAVDKAALIGGWRAFATGHFGGAVFRTDAGDI